eukprot:g1977.t1
MLGLVLLSLDHTKAISINATESSLAAPVWQAWALEYHTVRDQTTIKYDSTSSGKGLKALTTADASGRYQADFAGSDSLVTADMYQKFPTLQMVPALVVPLAIIFNLDGFKTTELVLDVDVAAKLFSASCSLTSLCESLGEPSPPGPPRIFTRFFATESPANWPHGVFETWPANLRPVVSQSENVYSLIGSVMSEPGGLGYVAYPFCLLTTVKYVSFSLLEHDGTLKIVAPSMETLRATMNRIELDDKLHASITSTPGDWPLTDFTYGVFHRRSNLTCQKTAEILKFFSYAFTNQNSRDVAFNLGYFPLPRDRVDYIIAYLSTLPCPETAESYLALDFSYEDSHDIVRNAMVGLAVLGITLAAGFWLSIIAARHSRISRVAGCTLNYVAMILWAIVPNTNQLCQACSFPDSDHGLHPHPVRNIFQIRGGHYGKQGASSYHPVCLVCDGPPGCAPDVRARLHHPAQPEAVDWFRSRFFSSYLHSGGPEGKAFFENVFLARSNEVKEERVVSKKKDHVTLDVHDCARLVAQYTKEKRKNQNIHFKISTTSIYWLNPHLCRLGSHQANNLNMASGACMNSNQLKGRTEQAFTRAPASVKEAGSLRKHSELSSNELELTAAKEELAQRSAAKEELNII